MSRRRSTILVTLAGLAVLGAGLAATARGGIAIPRCVGHQLTPVYVDSSGAAGSIDAEYGLRNLGAHACELTGYPRLQMLKASGRPLSTTEQLAPGSFGINVAPVVVAHMKVAYFGVHFAAQTGYGNLKCPSSAALSVTAPGSTVGSVLHGTGGRIQPYGGSIPHLRCGILNVSPVSAKRFQ